MSERYRPLSEALSQSPQDLRVMMRAIDKSNRSIDTCFVDSVLGIPIIRGRGREYIGMEDNLQDHDSFDFIYEGTKYNSAREILHKVKPQKDDVVYDLGSGYGRFCFYGSLTTDAAFKGIEIVERRVKAANSIKERFGIDNLTFTQGDVTEQDFSDGTIFYLFNPFYPQGYSAQKRTERALRDLARKKPITIVTHHMKGMYSFYLGEELEVVEDRGKTHPLGIYRSKSPLL